VIGDDDDDDDDGGGGGKGKDVPSLFLTEHPTMKAC
jgi:hypothetical protein